MYNCFLPLLAELLLESSFHHILLFCQIFKNARNPTRYFLYKISNIFSPSEFNRYVSKITFVIYICSFYYLLLLLQNKNIVVNWNMQFQDHHSEDV